MSDRASDPTSSFVAAFSELARRIGLFMCYVFTGVAVGLLSALPTYLISRFTQPEETSNAPAEAYDHIADIMSAADLSSSMPPLASIITMGGGSICILYGIIFVMRGSTQLAPIVCAVVGGSLLALTSSMRWGLEPTWVTWLTLIILLACAQVLARLWKKKQDDAWQAELDEIYEENRKRREAKSSHS